jgi:UDP-glucose 4-epimerase
LRILVTGGAGFVGSHVTDRLVERGDEVFVLDDLSRGREEWLADGAQLYRLDIRNRNAVLGAFADAVPEAVVHLAALHYIPAVDDAPAVARAINVDGTRNIVDAVAATQPRRVVFASTAAVYPDTAEPISERVPVAPIDLYGETKAAGEALFAQTGASCAFARLFNVMGPRETNPHILPEIVAQIASGADTLALGTTGTVRDFIDVRDVADALVRLVDHAQVGCVPFNVGTGHGTSVAELVALCGAAVGRTVTIRHDSARVRPVDRARLVADASALTKATGWQPARSVAETIAELVRVEEVVAS